MTKRFLATVILCSLFIDGDLHVDDFFLGRFMNIVILHIPNVGINNIISIFFIFLVMKLPDYSWMLLYIINPTLNNKS